MERTISQEERIRRAEEIYNRRRQGYSKTYVERYNESADANKQTIKARLIKKTIYQLIVSLLIYLVLYVMLNSNYFFSESIHNRINDFLSYDMQFSNLYNQAVSYINSNDNIIKKMIKKDNNSGLVENAEQENSTENTEENMVQNTSEDANAIGGAEENVVAESKSQNDMDVDFIKQNCNIIWPLKGTITSKYGTREATEIVTANHYGIDIAGNTGDTIVAAMDGKVALASPDGEYGKHIVLTNGEVSNVYAHCSKLCVSEGENIKQGQKIAEVGQTGRATGPHLHFEIKRDDRTIDPEKILGEVS